ncbi:MAG: UvrD-helicase domain-containing protein, partial [Streptococcaceae bacterium]|nr:UvrD-helicase domain-containing protein [Streptococcaceae bacterium]
MKLPIKPPHAEFTDEQWQAIHQSGKNLLISASAGSGKTKVLVDRVMQKLLDGESITNLVLVTFTEDAAREMKERLQAKLEIAINQETDNDKRRHFVLQKQLLPQAYISTFHSFCRRILEQFYFYIDLDPGFSLLTNKVE